MHITIITFSSVRTACGFREKKIECPDSSSVHDVMEMLFVEHADLVKMKGKLLFAVNEVYSTESNILHEGDKLAIFPPVSGGSC